jgi:hypothetical protein
MGQSVDRGIYPWVGIIEGYRDGMVVSMGMAIIEVAGGKEGKV